MRSLPLIDGAEDDYGDRGLRVREVSEGAGRGWELHRRSGEGWELAHTHDELPVRPVDVVHGHHFTSTYPSSIFRQMLMVVGHAIDRHLSLTESTVTERRPGLPVEHREINRAELPVFLDELNVPLTRDEQMRLLDRVSAF